MLRRNLSNYTMDIYTVFHVEGFKEDDTSSDGYPTNCEVGDSFRTFDDAVKYVSENISDTWREVMTNGLLEGMVRSDYRYDNLILGDCWYITSRQKDTFFIVKRQLH